MPILQKRINKDTFGEVLEKVASRLSGWKKQTLKSCRKGNTDEGSTIINTGAFDEHDPPAC